MITRTLSMLPSTRLLQSHVYLSCSSVFIDNFEQVFALRKETVFTKKENPCQLIVVLKRELPFHEFRYLLFSNVTQLKNSSEPLSYDNHKYCGSFENKDKFQIFSFLNALLRLLNISKSLNFLVRLFKSNALSQISCCATL